MLGAGKYGLTQLANLAQLPPTGAVVVVAPLKLVRGTGSPARVLALVPRPEPRYLRTLTVMRISSWSVQTSLYVPGTVSLRLNE